MKQEEKLCIECSLHEDVKALDDRVHVLEKSDVRMTERVDNLIKQLESLTAWVKTLVILLVTTLGGFFIWYVQNKK